MIRKVKVIKAIPPTSREKRANDVQAEAHTVPSKASNTKTRIFGNREEQTSIRQQRNAIATPIAQDETDRHIMRNLINKNI
jgi:hypothetical protein